VNKPSLVLWRRVPALRLLYCVFCIAVLAHGQKTVQQYYEEAQKALAEKRLEAAANAYESLTRLDPKTAENYAQLGLIRYMQGSFGASAPAFRRALELKPGLLHVDVLLAICLSELGQYADAEQSICVIHDLK